MLQVQEKADLDVVHQYVAKSERSLWPQRFFVGFLVVYGALLAWFCWVKVLAFDELLSFYTASAPSVQKLLAFQRTTPVSLDPPLVHLAAHGFLRLGISPVFAMRLPSLLGAVVMVVCVYWFAYRLAGRALAAFTVVGLLIFDQFHLVEARPYGVMLGLAALALVLWQNALRDEHRAISVLGLFLTLGAAISSHYFGILLVVPFVVAEAFRTVRRRKLDAGLAAALSSSPLFAALWLPFLAGAHQYKSNYYIKLQWADLARSYTSSFQSALHIHSQVGQWLLFALTLSAIALGGWLGYTRSRGTETDELPSDTAAEWICVMAFALLPVGGVILARIASGAFEIRYVVAFTLGTSICLAGGLLAIVKNRTTRIVLLTAGCILAVALLGKRARQDSADRIALEQVAHLVSENPDERTIITDKEEFLWLHAYHPRDTGPAQSLWVADMSREIAATGSDNIDRTMVNLKTMAGLPVVSFDQATHASLPMKLIVSDASDPRSWLPAAMAGAGVQETLVQTSREDHVYQIQPVLSDIHR